MTDGYEARYVIVAGILWLRCTTGAPAGETKLWAATFDGDARMRTRTIASEGFGDVPLEGEVDGLDWDLRIEELAPPFRSPHPLLRRLTPAGIETWPALRVSGRIGERAFDRAPGHRARVWGKRHAQSWCWAHGSTADGRWTQLLSAKVAGLPRLSQHATERGGPSFPVERSERGETGFRVGHYVVDAPQESFLGVQYHDPDGSPVTCLHSERGHLRGPGVELREVAVELGAAGALA
jgi:hypothetical protein